MHVDKSRESSAQSTDSEQAGTRSAESESTSSLGGSAAAAARVLAAWQDRATSSADEAAAVAAVAAAAAVGEPSALWPTAQSPVALHHSAAPTPTPRGSGLMPHMRENSAPVAGSAHDTQRADMGLLALLNSAAAYVAESADSRHAEAYRATSDLLPGAALTLSSINDNFNQASAAAAAAAAAADDSRASYSSAYDAQFSSAAYQDLAQALQHIAATSAGPESGVPRASDTDGQPPPLGTRPFPGGTSMDSGAMAVAAAVAGVCPDLVAPGGDQSKRKRRDGGRELAPLAKRRSSSAADHGRSSTGGSGEMRRMARKWTEEETESLLQGCSKYGVGAWKKILDDPTFAFNNRTSVDLKDRFRTIRAQECAQNPAAKVSRKNNGKVPDVVWPLPPGSQRLQGLHRVQRKPTRNYSADEDRRLLLGVLRHANHWTKIAADTDLHLGHRPGQSLRDRLRNAFPEVFELFGYVIPKKERADRERVATPGPQSSQDHPPLSATSKRKAATGSKRLDGDIPDHIRERIMAILHSLNASLDPHPIPDDDDNDNDDDDDSGGDSDADSGATSHHGSCAPSSRHTSEAADDGRARARHPAASRVASTGSKGSAASRSPGSGPAASDSGKGRRRASTRGGRAPARSGSDSALKRPNAAGGSRQDGRGGLGFATEMVASGVHSAPTHGAAEQMAQHHRNLMGDFLSPSAFLRQIGTMTPTDQLDALALEGRITSGYSTPTHSSKRRHSIQANFNEALAAAAAAAAMGRSGIGSGLGFFHTGIPGLEHAGIDANGLPINTADSMRRMTVAGPVGADPYLFPRLPDEDAAVAAAVAAAADMSAQLSSAQQTARVPDGCVGQTVDTSGAGALSEHSAPVSAYVHGQDHLGHRGQFRSAQRLLRANGVADDNSIGLSSASAGDGSMDMEALTQLGEWFPGFGSGGIGWGVAGTSAAGTSSGGGADISRLCNESIDPNMLDAGHGAAGHDASQTHARRRSQFDWYGITPSLAAALEAAGTTAVAAAAAAAAADASSGLAPLSIGTAGPAVCRRPSMPVFPSFSYPQGSDMLGLSMTTAEPAEYGSGPTDGSGIAAAAAAAAAAVAVALSDGSESMGIQTAAGQPHGQPHGMRSYSLGAGTAITSSALAKVAGLVDLPHRPGPAPVRPRVASTQHGRRRTMHVPPSLVEDVASSEFGDCPVPVARPHLHHDRRPYAYPPRPTNAPRARRISSTASSGLQQAGAGAAQLFLTPVSEAAGADLGGLRHARTYSGTQLPQDVPGGLAGGNGGPGSSASSDSTNMDMDMDAATALGAADAGALDLSFKASFWAAAAAEDAAQMAMDDDSLTPTADRQPDPRRPRSAASTPGRREAVGI